MSYIKCCPEWEDKCFIYHPTIEQVEKCEAPRIIKDYFVKSTRTTHECGICRQEIKPKSYARVVTDSFEGEIATQYFCVDCCDAMVKHITGTDENVLIERWEIGANIG